MIRVTCPTCRSKFDTQETYAGRMAKCPNCGGQLQIPQAAPSPAPAYATPPPAGMPSIPGVPPANGLTPTKHSGLSIAGFSCGLGAFLFSVIEIVPCIGCWLLPLIGPAAIAGLICSILGLLNAKKTNMKKGLAIAGIVLSILAIIWAPLVFFIFLGGMGSVGAMSQGMHMR